MGSIAFALATAGSIFTNLSLTSLQSLFPLQPQEVLQEAISGTSGAFIQTLGAEDRERVLGVLGRGLRVM
ncbi:MAG: hypothetical protein CL912_18165 [Deltaproteobacteria bacterium]|nr:hypothetical protein [Deltaproteobacteria bacterium]|tara:strand:+ start:114 stop:323 length:210 start_codon:yes stop_codon:yes gene_type:complete